MIITMRRFIWRAIKPTKRNTLSMLLIVIAMGRLGVYTYATSNGVLPNDALAGILLLASLALWATARRRRRWYARCFAGLAAAILGGMAWAVWPNHTSALILAVLTYASLGEVGAVDDC